jgi:hypothetical protein
MRRCAMRSTHTGVLVVLALSLFTPVLADIAPPRQFGQSLSPGEATMVAMTAEAVTVTLTPKEAFVSAVFDLSNTGDDEQLVVGFPEAAPGGRPTVRLLDFRASVDGKEVRHTAHLPGTEAGGDEALRGWITWPMEFPAGCQRKVEVSYRVPYQTRYVPTLLGDRDFTYVLVTGAAWRGSIGKALIEVQCTKGLTPDHLGDIKLEGFERTATGLRWKLTDLEPGQDVVLSVRKFKD